MQTRSSDVYVRQIFDLTEGLPEEQLRRVLAFVQKVKEEPQRPTTSLTSPEIMALANERAVDLRRQARPLAEAQYQALLQAIQADVEVKGVGVEDFPRAIEGRTFFVCGQGRYQAICVSYDWFTVCVVPMRPALCRAFCNHEWHE